MPEPGVGTSEVLSGGGNGEPEATEVVSKPRLSGKGKGKEKVVEEEEMLQELNQKNV